MKNLRIFMAVLSICFLLLSTVSIGWKAAEAINFHQENSGDIFLLEMRNRDAELRQAKATLYELDCIEQDGFAYEYTYGTEIAKKAFQETVHLSETRYIPTTGLDVLFSDNPLSYQDTEIVQTPSPTPKTSETLTSVPVKELMPEPSSEPVEIPGQETVVLMKRGFEGGDLLKVKQRLYELGYFTDTGFSRKYTKRTEEVVRQFQEMNGLPVTGVYTNVDESVLFSEDVQPAPTPTPLPTAEPLPTVRPLMDEQPPLRDEEGYLVGGGEYVYENDELGQWVYLNESIQIMINRYEDISVPLVWFESEILLRGEERLQSIHIDANDTRKNMRFMTPQDLAVQKNLLFGFTDDFYDYRVYHGERIGIIIRNGELKYDQPYSKRMTVLPNLDMMAQYEDGRLVCYPVGTVTAEQLMQEKAVNVYCFGPVVLHDGEVDSAIMPKNFAQKFPRQFLGMIEPNHYLVLTVLGRTSTSEGIGCLNAAQMLLQRGVTEALNLDGGNTMAIVFRGRMLNEKASWKTRKYVRSISSLIGVGYWEASADEGEQ